MDLKQVGEMIVDLRRSTWDKSTSDPDNGVYNFTKKTLVPTRGTADREHELTWSRYAADNGYRELNAHRAEGYTPVLVSQNLYFPQGCFKNPAGMWQFGDVVLIMRPMTMFLEKRMNDVKTSEAQAKAIPSELSEGAFIEDKRIT